MFMEMVTSDSGLTLFGRQWNLSDTIVQPFGCRQVRVGSNIGLKDVNSFFPGQLYGSLLSLYRHHVGERYE